MSLYISVVSHGHEKIIKTINCLPKLAELSSVQVILLDNLGQAGLKSYCNQNTLEYIPNTETKGFGENNNIVFQYCEKELGMKQNDLFLVLNPDVNISTHTLEELLSYVKKDASKMATINLYKDRFLSIPDYSIRKFPSFINFLYSFIGLGNSTIIQKDLIEKPTVVDWAAGSFLIFEVSLYRELGGFDESYFMYCEDIDICWRGKQMSNAELIYYPDVMAVHLAQHANRKVLSRHFYWHVKSMFRYLAMHYGLRKPKIKINKGG